MHVIGLTGGLGSGKSCVASMFAALGAKVIDADKIAHQLMRPGKTCYGPVLQLLGAKILSGGRINRKKVAGLVFNDSRLLRKLEQIVHPHVRKEIASRLQKYARMKTKPIVVLDVPLLFESGFNKLVTTTIVVYANRSKQIDRSMKKLNISELEAKQRMKEQMPLRQKSRLADMTIDNNGSLTQMKRQVKKLWRKLQ